MEKRFNQNGREITATIYKIFAYAFTVLIGLFIAALLLACRHDGRSGSGGGIAGGDGGGIVVDIEDIYTVLITMEGDQLEGNSISALPKTGIHGEQITIKYTVADLKFYNRLDFDGVAVYIDPVESAEQGTRSYTLDENDAVDGIINIIAEFSHTDLELDPIEFMIAQTISKIYGTDETFINSIIPGHKGSGEISYFSRDTSVASVDHITGEVTIHKAGSTVISAVKEADAVYARGKASYTLDVARAKLAAPAAPEFSDRTKSPTHSITLGKPVDADLRYALEYAHNEIDAVPSGGWQDNPLFDSLDGQIAHYFFARYKYNQDKNDVSAASSSLFAITDDGDGTFENPFKVHDVETLQRVGKETDHEAWNLSAHYKMLRNIDMSGVEFTRIGDDSGKENTRFSGWYNGNGKKITGLTIDSSEDYQGMFGMTHGAVIENLGLENVEINGGVNVGALVGYNHLSLVKNIYVTGKVSNTYGSVESENNVGGLVGHNIDSLIINSYVTAEVAGKGTNIGGVAGHNSAKGKVQNSYATGDISGREFVAGVVGLNSIYSIVENSAALNKNIKVTQPGTPARGRITSAINDGILINNYGREDVAPHNGVTSNLHGLNIKEENYYSGSWWEGTAKFSAEVWNLQAGKLPTLKGIEGVQNPELLR